MKSQRRPKKSKEQSIPRKLLKRANSAFDGDTEAARQWLATAQVGLGGKVPLALARSKRGEKLVMQLLTRIDFGVYA